MGCRIWREPLFPKEAAPPRHTYTCTHTRTHMCTVQLKHWWETFEMPTDVVPRCLSKFSPLSLVQSWLIGETVEPQEKFLFVISNLAAIA